MLQIGTLQKWRYVRVVAGGLVQIAQGRNTSLELINATIANGTTAMIVILAISLGLMLPKLTIDYLDERWPQADDPRRAP
jgi:hypothetical protein